MSARPWMPLYIADYLADTGHLSTVEHGAYMLLIMHYWQNGGLPDDERRMCRICRMSPDEWAESRDTLADLFDDGWRHKRIDAEINRAEDVSSKRRAAAEKRHSKSNANAPAIAEQKHTQSQSHTQVDTDVSTKRARDTEFDDWYQHYPHKVGRGQAEKAFVSARKLASLDDLIVGVKRYAASKPPDRQWRNPATWLNGKGWLDAPATLAPSATSPPPKKTVGQQARDELRRMGMMDASDEQTRHYGQGDRGPDFAGIGFARRIASTASG